MGTRIKYDEPPEYVRPKLDDLDIPSVDYSAVVGVPDLSGDLTPPDSGGGDSPEEVKGKGYAWSSWSLALDFSDLGGVTDGIERFLEAADKLTKVVVGLLKLIRMFSSDFKSISRLLKVLLKIIVKQVQEIIDSFASTGIYVSLIFPDFDIRSEDFVLPVNGGYREFVQRVNATCLNSKDEDAPKFGKEDTVGGLVLAMIGGANDPRFLQDLIENFQVLSSLFRLRNPTPSPAKNVRAVPGFYKKKEEDGSTHLAMGVKVMWDHPGTPLSGFVLRRSRYRDGVKVRVSAPKGAKEETEVVRVYRDEKFDAEGIKRFPAVVGRPRYSYVDFTDLKENEMYFYKVFTEVGYDFWDKNAFYQRIESPTASKAVYAIPRNKIPLSELAKETLYDDDGNRVDSEEMESDWQSLSIRTLLGPEVDRLFSLMDRLTDKLLGMVDTSSDAMTEYLNFIQKKIKFYLDIINKVADIIERLSRLRLSGTFLLLSVHPEDGGMQGFVDKFNSAVLTEEVGGLQIGSKDKKTPSIASLTEEGIMAGVMFVYGYPSIDSGYFQNLAAEDQAEQLTKSLERSKKALKAFLGLLGLGE